MIMMKNYQKTSHPFVYIIVLNWNGTRDTIRCLESIRAQDYPNYTVVVVDNGSEERSLLELKSWLQANFELLVCYDAFLATRGGNAHSESLLAESNLVKKAILIENGTNLGFAAGNNVAIRYARGVCADYLLLLNNDTIVTKAAVRLLIDFYENNPQYTAIVPQLRFMGDPDYIWNCGGQITWYGHRKYYYQGMHHRKIDKEDFDISFATGCAILFRLDAVELFSEKFFFGEEDFELSLRFQKQGKKMACLTKAVVFHKVGSSKDVLFQKRLGEVFVFYLQRLLDNRDYSSKFNYFIKSTVFYLYIFYFLLAKKNCSLIQIVNFFKALNSELKVKTGVDKEMFFAYSKEDFR